MQEKLKIVLVESYPQVIAGQQRTLLSLLEQVDEDAVQPLVLLPGPGRFAEKLQDAGWEVHIAPYPETLARYGGEIYRDGLVKRVRLLRDLSRYIWGLRQALKAWQPAAVFYNDMRGLLTAGVAAKSLAIPGVIWDKLDKPHGRLDWFQLPLVAKNPIISGPVAMKYPAWQRRWYRDRIKIVPNGVDFERFKDTPGLRQKFGFDDTDVVFGIVGTVTYRKAHDVLLSAFQLVIDQFPQARLLVVGSWLDCDNDRAFYQRLSERNVRGVSFLGSRDDIPELMHSLDALVIPSRFEGLGQVTLEAMAAGLPVIGSRVGGIAEAVIDGETGFLFDSEDVVGLGQAMLRMATDPALRQQMGQAGRARARSHYNRGEKMSEIWRIIREASVSGVPRTHDTARSRWLLPRD